MPNWREIQTRPPSCLTKLQELEGKTIAVTVRPKSYHSSGHRTFLLFTDGTSACFGDGLVAYDPGFPTLGQLVEAGVLTAVAAAHIGIPLAEKKAKERAYYRGHQIERLEKDLERLKGEGTDA